MIKNRKESIMLYKELRNKKEMENELNHTDVPKGSMAIWSLGQTGFIFKNAYGDMIAVDPYLSYNIEKNDPTTEFKREYPPVLDPQQLANINGVFVTHFHDDHMDVGTLTELTKVNNKIPYYIPTPDHNSLKEDYPDLKGQVNATLTGKTIKIGNFEILPIASAHENADYDKDEQGNDRYVGYFISCDDIKIYHSGDTSLTKELIAEVKKLSPDIMMLAINGGDYYRANRDIAPNMNFREACDFFNDVNGDLIIPCHFDMFSNNSDNIIYYLDYLSQNYSHKKNHVFVPGERFIYMK